MTEVLDKHGVLDRIAGAKLDLGCGPRKRGADYIGVDVVDQEGVDLVGDVFDVLARIPDGSLSRVFSSHFMEHIDDITRLVGELGRVIRPGGQLETVVPHFSNPYFYSDVTHRTPFGLYSMSYFVKEPLFKREVPLYANPPLFALTAVDLTFKAPRPFYGRYALTKLLGAVFNLSRATKELYEGTLCFWFPCYELTFLMTRLDESTNLARLAGDARTS
jgi:SAM-dependent methyltransferase